MWTIKDNGYLNNSRLYLQWGLQVISNDVAANKIEYYTEHPCTLQQNKQQASQIMVPRTALLTNIKTYCFQRKETKEMSQQSPNII